MVCYWLDNLLRRTLAWISSGWYYPPNPTRNSYSYAIFYARCNHRRQLIKMQLLKQSTASSVFTDGGPCDHGIQNRYKELISGTTAVRAADSAKSDFSQRALNSVQSN